MYNYKNIISSTDKKFKTLFKQGPKEAGNCEHAVIFLLEVFHFLLLYIVKKLAMCQETRGQVGTSLCPELET